MEIRVLGPLEASDQGRPIALGGTKQRAMLAMLALDANRTVDIGRSSAVEAPRRGTTGVVSGAGRRFVGR